MSITNSLWNDKSQIKKQQQQQQLEKQSVPKKTNSCKYKKTILTK